MSNTEIKIETFMEKVIEKNPGQIEFHQAVREFMEYVIPYVNQHPEYQKAAILDRLVEPDRSLSFRVVWEDDNGEYQVNRGHRVQFNNAIGPYKGGLRFDPSVNQSILKFLGFEQIFKNSLTGLPLGGGKGGSDFNPKGKSDQEIMRFCQSFMSELYRHIGKNVDVPAGDIGVDGKAISYLFGQYKRISGEFAGTMTGKGLSFGGSAVRREATGYGAVYMAKEMLSHHDREIKGKIAIVSGSGNVAQYASEKLIELGARVVALSDRDGTIHVPTGITLEHLDAIKALKSRRGSLKEFAEKFGVEFLVGQKPWGIKCDLAFPCATQNEISLQDAEILVSQGVELICEGANMPTEIEGVRLFLKNNVLFAPSKAANAGGVAISGLEMTQNAMRLSWSHEKVDSELKKIMKSIHEQCVKYGQSGENINYVKGANIAGFVKVAEAMLSYGVM